MAKKKTKSKSRTAGSRRGRAGTTAVTAAPPRRRAAAKSRSSAAVVEPPFVPSIEEIAVRAFLKWQERGGDELSNWLDAEQELHAERRASMGVRRRGTATERRAKAGSSTGRRGR